MNERMDGLAQELLQKTRDGRLDWRIMANPTGREEFSVDLSPEFRFHIWRVDSSESCAITLQLWKDGRRILESVADNWPSFVDPGALQAGAYRFRVYSDLFDAIRESVFSGAEFLGEAEKLLSAK